MLFAQFSPEGDSSPRFATTGVNEPSQSYYLTRRATMTGYFILRESYLRPSSLRP